MLTSGFWQLCLHPFTSSEVFSLVKSLSQGNVPGICKCKCVLKRGINSYKCVLTSMGKAHPELSEERPWDGDLRVRM